ncbi:hypothetical protein GCM10011532_08660 [Christiangramia forsetii]|uniref:Uncharacterized protein n=1 Tax=Christiangramia forsetii TaxID=411153 RepID=A0ABQ1WDL2_9FLAO|nr:hypothetical protein GCM10011532_08660 [Christiangramia forsetii]
MHTQSAKDLNSGNIPTIEKLIEFILNVYITFNIVKVSKFQVGGKLMILDVISWNLFIGLYLK